MLPDNVENEGLYRNVERQRAETKFDGENFVVESRIAIESGCCVEGQTENAAEDVGG